MSHRCRFISGCPMKCTNDLIRWHCGSCSSDLQIDDRGYISCSGCFKNLGFITNVKFNCGRHIAYQSFGINSDATKIIGALSIVLTENNYYPPDFIKRIIQYILEKEE